MESPEIIILEESSPRRASSEEEDEEMLEATSLSVKSQVVLLKSILAAKQGEIDKLSDNLEREKMLRKQVENKYNKLRSAFAGFKDEIGEIVEGLQENEGEEGGEDDIVKRELDQLSDNLQKRLDKSKANGVEIRGEIEELNKQLENFIQVHLPGSISRDADAAPEPEATAPAPLPAKRLSIKPVRLMEEIEIQQNLKKVRKQVRVQAQPSTSTKKFTNQHAIDTTHANQKTFYCICGRRFCSRSKVQEHVKYHTREWKFRCDLCRLRCAGANYLRQHYYLVHKIKLASKFGCRECGGMLDTRRELLRHQAIMHKKPKPTNQVTIATNEDTQEVNETDDDIQEIPIPAHEKTSDNQPPPPPPQPPTHLPENQSGGKIGYDGKIHGKDVSKMDSTGSGGFRCICGKGYNNAPTLLHHIKYQTWQWRFRCSECGLLFYGANYLRKHMVSAHKVEPGVYIPTFGCRRCGKLFKQYAQLVLHQRLAHRTKARDPLE